MQEYNAKLSDFGLAKAGPQGDKTHVSTRVVGTYGYAAPEYLMTGEESSLETELWNDKERKLVSVYSSKKQGTRNMKQDIRI